MEKLILLQKQCPGDWLCCLAAVESLHIQYPGKYITDIHCGYPDLFLHHPNITRMRRVPNIRGRDIERPREIDMQCPSINRTHAPIHFLQTWCEFLGDALGLPLRLHVSHPTIYLSEQEKGLPKLKNHWIVNAGYKADCEAKWWGWSRYQKVVEMMPHLNFIQIGESFHFHKPLVGPNVINMIGKTDKNCRDLLRMVSQCDGGLGGVTFLQHVCASLQKPYVCLNFREPNWLTAYPRQTMLSMNGKLDCNRERGCWVSAVREGGHGRRCALPVIANGEAVPKCATMIAPEDVVKAIQSYYITQ